MHLAQRSHIHVLYIGNITLLSLLVLLGTFLLTTCRFHLGVRFGTSQSGCHKPATLPYWLPWIGSGLALATNPHRFYEHAFAKSPGRRPIRVRITSLHMYLVAGVDNIQTLFRKSRDLTFEFMQLRVAQAVKGLPAQDAAKMGVDNSGTHAVPLTPVAEEDRIWKRLHHIYLENLSQGRAVDGLTRRFLSEFSQEVEQLPEGECVTTPIYALLQDKMFRASTHTLTGSRILTSNPDFAKHFWEYDAGFMKLLMGTPRFMCRQAWNARDQCLAATKRWLADAWAATDWSAMALKDLDWEPNFGHRLVRAREECLEQFGISLDGRASLQMGLIWAINANAIPMAAYMLIELIYDPLLLERVRDELASVAGLSGPSSGDIDVAALCALPLLGSVYRECLRLRASIPLTRRLHKDIEIGGCTLRAGNFILAPSWLSHRDESVWSTPEHSAQVFWAELTSIRTGDFFPYGGGSIMCPGRFFAKQEILAAVAIIITSFDIKFVRNVHLDGAPSDRGPGVENCESRGIIPLDRDVVVEMRRRASTGPKQ
ncbi:cytochrome P450 [Thozetella sp. PMI_491]|nr:cytochrome P450 [Thozetella sp. PMI_491]